MIKYLIFSLTIFMLLVKTAYIILTETIKGLTIPAILWIGLWLIIRCTCGMG